MKKWVITNSKWQNKRKRLFFFTKTNTLKKPTKPKTINSKRTRPYSLPLSCQCFFIAILLANLANQHSEVMVITSVAATNVPCIVLLDTWVEVRGIKKKKAHGNTKLMWDSKKWRKFTLILENNCWTNSPTEKLLYHIAPQGTVVFGVLIHRGLLLKVMTK